ncbi:hypothetical protein [Dapis sp. BLCC M229]|uniref:hypothetical protein n=1 Tax=Dapis sp. BLCC M229 TaxID=3400188 RepID=UPI003CF6E9E7
MMKYILTGFRELLPEQEQENLSDEIISKIIEIHPPLGLKKQITANSRLMRYSSTKFLNSF